MTSNSSNSPSARGRPVHQKLHDTGNRSIIVFLTVCTVDRRQLLASPVIHACLREAWLKADHWSVGRYVVMPDHIHLFCAPATNSPVSLPTWIAYWKRLVAFNEGGSFWQKNFWDAQLRRHENYQAKWDYVRLNPVRAGLVREPDAWQFQGELNDLSWHN